MTDFKLHIPVDDTPTITVEVLVTENQMVRLAEIVKKYKLKVAEEEIIDAKVLEK